jgi:hypothetical protein
MLFYCYILLRFMFVYVDLILIYCYSSHVWQLFEFDNFEM